MLLQLPLLIYAPIRIIFIENVRRNIASRDENADAKMAESGMRFQLEQSTKQLGNVRKNLGGGNMI